MGCGEMTLSIDPPNISTATPTKKSALAKPPRISIFQVRQNVWSLYKDVIKKNIEIPVLIEWDENIPEFEILEEEGMKAKHLASEV